MSIKAIQIQNAGFVTCRSTFCVMDGCLKRETYFFVRGVNRLVGDIDSGNWAVSYLLSMYSHRKKDFNLFEKPCVIVNGEQISLEELARFVCYMDFCDPLFSGRCSVRKKILHGISSGKTNCLCEELEEQFLDKDT